MLARSFQVAPESVETQSFPSRTTPLVTSFGGCVDLAESLGHDQLGAVLRRRNPITAFKFLRAGRPCHTKIRRRVQRLRKPWPGGGLIGISHRHHVAPGFRRSNRSPVADCGPRNPGSCTEGIGARLFPRVDFAVGRRFQDSNVVGLENDRGHVASIGRDGDRHPEAVVAVPPPPPPQAASAAASTSEASSRAGMPG